MLIKALAEYYDILEERGEVCPKGLSEQRINYIVMLRQNGEIAEIIKDERTERFPERTQKPGIEANIIEHRPLYIFGLNYDKAGFFTPEDATGKAKKSHESFKKTNLDFTEGLESELAKAYRSFILRWNPENETQNEHLLKLGKDYAKGYYAFALDGRPDGLLNRDGAVLEKYFALKKEPNGETGVCSVSGETGEIARIHDKIKGILGGQSSGCSLVSFNSSAEEHFGKSQSLNGPVAQSAMKKYTAALNMLLADERHRKYISDMTIVFWAMGGNGKEEDIFAAAMGSDSGADENETYAMVSNAVESAAKGRAVSTEDINIDEVVTFYIVGLAPNVSRVSQKFIYKDRFGKIFENVVSHQVDFHIDGMTRQVSIGSIIAALKKFDKDKMSPPLLSKLFEAIISGGLYPDALMAQALGRVKVTGEAGSVRAGIIKAYLNRKARKNNKTEEITVALDKENKNAAYLCGRLFAVYEKIQENAAGGKLNRTIKDTYFASACERPAAVFAKLSKLAQYHMKKDDYADYHLMVIGEITDKLEGGFPSLLSQEEQGKFVIGYYHQRKED